MTAETPLKFEGALAELEQIVQRLERGELALEESLALYERGVALSRLCHEKLEEAEGRIELLLKDGRGDVMLGADGKPRTAPLPAEPADDDDKSR